MRLGIRSFKPKNHELVKSWRSALTQPGTRIFGFLNRIFVLASVGWKRPVPFVRSVLLSEIYTHDSDADCLPASSLEFFSLPDQIANYSVDLFDHRFGQYFGLHSDFDCRYRTTRHGVPFICDRLGNRNTFTKRPVAPPSWNTDREILGVQHPTAGLDTFTELCRFTEAV